MHLSIPRAPVLSMLVLVSLLPGVATHAEPDASWVARMDAFAASLSQLLPDVLADNQKADPARDDRIRRNARALAGLTHDLSKLDPKKLPDSDPTVPLLARELDRAVNDADKAKGAHLKDAALLVATTCIACHTRTDTGAPRPRLNLAPPDASLAPWLKADIYTATRRFEEARTAYRAVVKDERFAESEPALWERSVKRALVVEVRAARDPKSALELVEQVLRSPAIEKNTGLQRDASGWRASLRSWVQEGPRPTTRDGLYALAQKLMDQAATQQRAPDDSTADILHLRATSALHELLAQSPDSNMRAQALAWLGEAYEDLRDLDVWSLYLLYDEACIEAAPHSVVAGECYERLVRGTLSEQTGNSGQPVADDISARLKRLQGLASPKALTPTPTPPTTTTPTTKPEAPSTPR